jgi:hypothetical protein
MGIIKRFATEDFVNTAMEEISPEEVQAFFNF